MGYYWSDDTDANFSDLKGVILSQVEVNKEAEEIRFTTEAGDVYVLHHEQDCCESVWIEDINGDIDDLIGEPILIAEEVSQVGESGDYGSSTWTFYKIATIKGTVVLRWIGESNGYYSESVDFIKLNTEEAQSD